MCVAFDYVDHNKLWKILKQVKIPDHLTCLLRNKAVSCHSAHLTYMQSSSCEMPGWVNHKLESRLPGEMSTSSGMQIIRS